jgi:hypothetical protein
MYIQWCIYKSGSSQAVRLPKKFRVKSRGVEIFRRGDEIVLREKAGMGARYLLDTNICLYLRQNRTPEVTARFRRLQPGDAVLFGNHVWRAGLWRGAKLAVHAGPGILGETCILVAGIPVAGGCRHR